MLPTPSSFCVCPGMQLPLFPAAGPRSHTHTLSLSLSDPRGQITAPWQGQGVPREATEPTHSVGHFTV